MIFACKLKKNIKYAKGIRNMLYELKDKLQKMVNDELVC
jgi:hypothetical protein